VSLVEKKKSKTQKEKPRSKQRMCRECYHFWTPRVARPVKCPKCGAGRDRIKCATGLDYIRSADKAATEFYFSLGY